MSIYDEKKKLQSSQGIAKGIEASSLDIALDILQKGIYAFPIKSTIRELTSNCYDAIQERDTARDILTGKLKVEDVFMTDQVLEGVHQHSGWDPDYFDLNYLSTDPNSYIYYEEGTLKDTLRFVDNGVGLGKDRIRGYFNLN